MYADHFASSLPFLVCTGYLPQLMGRKHSRAVISMSFTFYFGKKFPKALRGNFLNQSLDIRKHVMATK